MPDSGQTVRTIVWAVVALFGVDLAAVVLLAVFLGDASAALVASILAALPATAAVLLNIQATAKIQDKVDTVASDTHDLKNGLLDAKVRAGVADVVHPDLLDPAYTDSGVEAADRSRRASTAHESGPPDGA